MVFYIFVYFQRSNYHFLVECYSNTSWPDMSPRYGISRLFSPCTTQTLFEHSCLQKWLWARSVAKAVTVYHERAVAGRFVHRRRRLIGQRRGGAAGVYTLLFLPPVAEPDSDDLFLHVKLLGHQQDFFRGRLLVLGVRLGAWVHDIWQKHLDQDQVSAQNYFMLMHEMLNAWHKSKKQNNWYSKMHVNTDLLNP